MRVQNFAMNFFFFFFTDANRNCLNKRIQSFGALYSSLLLHCLAYIFLEACGSSIL